MTGKILPDTSAWVHYFREPEHPFGEIIETEIAAGNVVISGTVLYELVQGCRSQQQEDAIMFSLKGLEFIEMEREDWIAAGRISGKLRSRGVSIPLADITIAALAINYDLTVLTTDKHFALIPGLCVSDGS